MLTESSTQGNNYFFLLLTVTSHGMDIFTHEINRIIVEKFSKLSDRCKRQLLWIIKQLIKNNVPRTDELCWNLLRCITQGDLSDDNRYLTQYLLDIFTSHCDWVYQHPTLLRGVVFTYLRILEDYSLFHYKDIRTKIAKYLNVTIRARFADLIELGREFVRVLVLVAKVWEIEALWQDILHRPTSLSQDFTGIKQLLELETPEFYLSLRISIDLESKLKFLLSHVPFSIKERFLKWFTRLYLNRKENHSILTDLIRFVFFSLKFYFCNF